MQDFDNNNLENAGTVLKGKTGLTRIINAAGYSCQGLKAALTEGAFRQLLVLNIILIPVALFCHFSTAITLVLILVSFITLIVELLNTAIEAAVDHTSLKWNPLAKRAKDVGSAAQLLSLILLIICWVVALIDR